jgi:hypothetical protein
VPLHAGDVGVGRLDDQPGRDAVLARVPDEAVEDDHVLLGDVVVLEAGDALALIGADRLVGVVIRGVGDDVGRLLRAGQDLGLDVDVAELGQPGLGHGLGELAQLVGGRAEHDRSGLQPEVVR